MSFEFFRRTSTFLEYNLNPSLTCNLQTFRTKPFKKWMTKTIKLIHEYLVWSEATAWQASCPSISWSLTTSSCPSYTTTPRTTSRPSGTPSQDIFIKSVLKKLVKFGITTATFSYQFLKIKFFVSFLNNYKEQSCTIAISNLKKKSNLFLICRSNPCRINSEINQIPESWASPKFTEIIFCANYL